MYRLFTLAALGWLVAATALLGGPTNVVAAAPERSDAAWAAIRAKFPADQFLPRPTWLPDRFRRAGQAVDNGLEFGVVYTSDEGERLLFGRTANACALPVGDTSQTVQPILVQGVVGTLTINSRPDCFPRIAAAWSIGGQGYTIQANTGPSGIALIPQDMQIIIAGLAATLPDGAPAPTPLLNGRHDVACFKPAEQCMAGPFRTYWEAHGGLARNGYPLTGEMVERLEDGRPYQVQYFERVRLEFHPEATDPTYRVQLGQFGRRVLVAVPDAPTAPVPARDGYRYFPETGHNVGPRFGAYWRENGGLAQFGYPLTELFEQRLEDGRTYRVQYFERARFEYHPENPAPYDVLLGQFGRRILEGATPRTIAIAPTGGPGPETGGVVVRGSGFTPGVVTRFAIRRDCDGAITGGNSLAGDKPANAAGTDDNALSPIGRRYSGPVGLIGDPDGTAQWY